MPKSILDAVLACQGDCRKCPATCPILDGQEPPKEAMHADACASSHQDQMFAICPSSGCVGCTVSPDNCPDME